MFGISALGWVHTLGSLPAIPAAAYMFARHGRIVPRSRAGALYFICMLIGAGSVFLVGHAPASFIIGAVTILLLLAGYAVGVIAPLGRAARYLETIFLTLTAFLLMLPTVTEVLRRVPDGRPWVTSLDSPLLRGFHLGLLLLLIVGLTVQIVALNRRGGAQAS